MNEATNKKHKGRLVIGLLIVVCALVGAMMTAVLGLDLAYNAMLLLGGGGLVVMFVGAIGGWWQHG